MSMVFKNKMKLAAKAAAVALILVGPAVLSCLAAGGAKRVTGAKDERAVKGDVALTSEANMTRVTTNADGRLFVNVSPQDARKIKSRKVVRYSDFGAAGNGKTDDMDAIAATHAFANLNGLPVKADANATYYIGGKDRTAVIRTDTDFGSASFIIDDTSVQNRNAHIFVVSSTLKPFPLKGVSSLRRNQAKIDAALPGTCLVTVTDSNMKRFIREGANRNSGASQTDVFIVDKNGNVDKNTPIIWDFDKITDIKATPLDKTTLTIKGGRFTTRANQAESKYNYHRRGIGIRRSNVVVDGVTHLVTGEGDHGAPYGGFIDVGDCAQVKVQNTILSGHKIYWTIGNAGTKVAMGTYDINVNRAINVSFVNCVQTNDILDGKCWGIFGSNFSKNLSYDRCHLSRFDAHMGVASATIRNSTLGHQGINAIGCGTLLVENCRLNGGNLVSLRSDYGSTWQGEFIIRNCVFTPRGGRADNLSLIGGSNVGQHDFGYKCTMPERITIENLVINDSKHSKNYQGPALFANFNPRMKDESYKEQFPYARTRQVILKNVTTASGKPVRISDNTFMFKDVQVTRTP